MSGNAVGMSIIAIDIDDVIAATSDAIRISVNDKFNVNLTNEHYSQAGEYWGYYERVWESNGLVGDDIFSDFVQDMLAEKVEINLLPGAVSVISELAKHNKIVFVTSRDSAWKDYTLKWLGSNFSFDDIEVHFTKSHLGLEHKTKGEICSDLGVSLLIDDNADHCKSAIEKGVGAILYGDYGWHSSVPVGVVRCKSWSEVLESVNE